MTMQELLSDESKWCQFAVAKNALNHLVLPQSPNACKWCVIGAMHRCYPGEVLQGIRRIESYLKLSRGLLGHWNDAPERMFKDIRTLVQELDL